MHPSHNHKKDTRIFWKMEERFSGFVDHKHPVYMEDLCFPRAMYKEDLYEERIQEY